jgi:hypothetical protein
MTPRRLFFIFLGVLTALRLLYIGRPELIPDEAYYSMWSERMDLSYYSKGPGVASAIWLGSHLFGMNEFGLRVLSPLLALGTSLLMYSFGKRLYGEPVGIWSALMINLVPIFNAGSLLMTIDPLSIFFWMAALYSFWLALERSPQRSWWWPCTGALIGLGFLCKYTNAMALVSIVLLLGFTRKYRREFKRPGFYLLLAAFLPFLLPPVIWNVRHDWITLAHLSARGGLQKAFQLNFGELLLFFVQHFGAYSPLLFGAMVAAVVWAVPLARRNFKSRFLLGFTLPLWALYLWLSLKQAGEANWTAPAMVSLAVLATALWYPAAQESAKKRRFCLAALLVGLGMSLLVVETDGVRSLGIHFPYQFDPSKRLRGWRSSAQQLESLRSQYEAKLGQPLFLIASSYGNAAVLGFYLKDKRTEGPGHPPIYFPESQNIENQFSFWPRYDEWVDLREYARSFLAATAVSEQNGGTLGALRTALEALPAPTATGPEADARWQTFVRALLTACPSLALDEYASREGGMSFFQGRAALYITDRAEEKAPSTLHRGFQNVEMIACIDQFRRGAPLRQWRVFLCTGYHGVSP